MVAARDFVQAMSLPVWQAMATARWLEGRVVNTPKPDEPTPAKAALSHADCVCQEVLVTALWQICPDVVLDAEEDTPAANPFAANGSTQVVRVDPIDGTLRYLQHDGIYAIIVGLEQDGRVEASLIGLPQEDVVIRAVRGGGTQVSRGGQPFVDSRFSGGGSRLLVSYGLEPDVIERLEQQEYRLVLAAGGAIGVAPLLEETRGALRKSPLPDGLSPRAWIAALGVQELGGVVVGLDGPLPECYQRGVRGMIVAGSQAEAEKIQSALR